MLIIQKRIIELQAQNNVISLAKVSMFSKSTTTAGLLLQSIIANHTDIGEHVLMANLDLSAAFNIVNVPLLLKRLAVLG